MTGRSRHARRYRTSNSAVKERRVFNNNRRQTPSGGSDFWESGNVRPDRILRDLRTIFSGGNADSLWYYKRLE